MSNVTPEMLHDLLMVAAWPLLTALLNAAVAMLGHSDKPWAQLLAKVGTQLLKQKTQEK